MCGIVGLELAPELGDASLGARLAYDGLFALQHRGQQSAGIGTMSSDGKIYILKELGLLTQVITEEHQLASLAGNRVLGHVRYSTTGAATWRNAQPHEFGLVHNGNLTNTQDLIDRFQIHLEGGDDEISDSRVVGELLTKCMDHPDNQAKNVVRVLLEQVLPELKGAFSMILADDKRLIGIKDRNGFHPLCLGQRDDGWVIASETKSLRAMQAKFVREVDPGEMVVIEEGVVTSYPYEAPDPKLCLIEIVYFAGHSSKLYGRENNAMRIEAGKRLAKVMPVEADMVAPVPYSSIPHAAGYAQASGIPYGEVLEANKYSGRTFIASGGHLEKAKRKFSVLEETVAGRDLVLVDDSIVRSSTMQAVVSMLKRFGAGKVHLRIAMDRWVSPCFYGINASTSDELAAANMTDDELCAYLGADSLAFLSLEELVAATGSPVSKFCTACMTGDYPVPPPSSLKLSSRRAN